eukprot:m.285841 g.285841  ORF g.285841 m.285841 type:complete len:84 (+) comp11461_c0_seq1:46-297(+)
MPWKPPTNPKCPKCDKDVFFAERVQALGKDWHKLCLKCGKCGKTLDSGKLSDHEGTPYCTQPCYNALFGAGGYGRGGTESHKY